MKDISLTNIKKGLSRFIARFHIVLFTVTILGGLAVIILLLYNVILTSVDSNGYTPESKSADFDQATIKRIEQLRTSNESDGQLDLSQGRTNPFVE
jgi:hypothetical protein